MDQRTLEQLEAIRKDHPEVDDLLREHRTLDEKVTDLDNKTRLSAEEDLELHQLKKEKLRIKDAIESLIHQKSA